MSNVKPKTWSLVLGANVAQSVSPSDGDKVTTALALLNKTGNTLFIGDGSAQDWEVPDGGQFEFSGIDESGSNSHSEINTKDVYVRSVPGGTVVVMISEGA